jgi:hypothetical protein
MAYFDLVAGKNSNLFLVKTEVLPTKKNLAIFNKGIGRTKLLGNFSYV